MLFQHSCIIRTSLKSVLTRCIERLIDWPGFDRLR